MTPLVPVTIFGWPLVVLLLFSLMPARRAVMLAMLGAWMFLPMAGYRFSGVPDITKMSVTSVSILLGTLIFDPARVSMLRLKAPDLLMVVWILIPIVSSVNAGYGAYEGLSGMLAQLVAWGFPYVIGRMYFSDIEGLRELAVGLFVGGLIYLPLVVYEARMSPILHTWLYGFHQHQFAQSKRGGGWRPTVFMQHGLAVALFMGTAAVCGMWLWAAGRMKAIKGVPVWILSIGLFVVAAACRSSYALLLMLSGISVLFASRLLGVRIILVALLAIAPAYVAARTVGGWDAGELRSIATAVSDRVESLEARLASEDVAWRFVGGHELVGRGRMQGMRASLDKEEFFIPDGLWVIALVNNGLIGVGAMIGTMLLPPLLVFYRFRARELLGRQMAGVAALATVVTLYAMDNLLNAMVNPIYLLAAGGLMGLATGASGGGRGMMAHTPRVRSPRSYEVSNS